MVGTTTAAAESRPLLARPVAAQLSDRALLDRRARQRTAAGYTRTALSEFCFALVILRLFEPGFVPFGALYTAFALLLAALGWVRAGVGGGDDDDGERVFTTSGTVVALASLCTVALHLGLLVMILTL